jgi:hypothetical protein
VYLGWDGNIYENIWGDTTVYDLNVVLEHTYQIGDSFTTRYSIGM